MKDFRFKVPQNIEFGVGSLKKLPEILNESKSEHVFLNFSFSLTAAIV